MEIHTLFLRGLLLRGDPHNILQTTFILKRGCIAKQNDPIQSLARLPELLSVLQSCQNCVKFLLWLLLARSLLGNLWRTEDIVTLGVLGDVLADTQGLQP